MYDFRLQEGYICTYVVLCLLASFPPRLACRRRALGVLEGLHAPRELGYPISSRYIFASHLSHGFLLLRLWGVQSMKGAEAYSLSLIYPGVWCLLGSK